MSQGGKAFILLITESFDQLHCSSDVQDNLITSSNSSRTNKQLLQNQFWLKSLGAYDEHLFLSFSHIYKSVQTLFLSSANC
jgi:hypothetical protein